MICAPGIGCVEALHSCEVWPRVPETGRWRNEGEILDSFVSMLLLLFLLGEVTSEKRKSVGIQL